jgi:ferredoxin
MDEALKTAKLPSPARLLRGRAAVTACPGQDECGMCAAACGFGALKKPGRDPIVDHDKCIGCGACVKACPRFNMRLIDGSKGEFAEITVKCLLSALPADGETVRVLDVSGAELGMGRVVQSYPLPDGRHGIVRFRTERKLLPYAAGFLK